MMTARFIYCWLWMPCLIGEGRVKRVLMRLGLGSAAWPINRLCAKQKIGRMGDTRPKWAPGRKIGAKRGGGQI